MDSFDSNSIIIYKNPETFIFNIAINPEFTTIEKLDTVNTYFGNKSKEYMLLKYYLALENKTLSKYGSTPRKPVTRKKRKKT